MKLSVIVILVMATFSDGAKILGLFTTHSQSHLIIHMSIVQILADRGHDVTVVTTLPVNDPKPNYRHIQILVPEMPEEIVKSATQKSISFIDKMNFISRFSMDRSNTSLNDPQMQKLMAEESFDLMIFGYFFNMFQIGVAAHFKCPYIISFMMRHIRYINCMIGNPTDPLLIPHMMTGESQPMGFLARVKSVFVYMLDYIMFTLVDLREQIYYDHMFPPDKYPSFDEMQKNVSLVLYNHHFSNGVVAPNVPAAVEIGGVQIKPKPDPLPEDIKSFLDGATNGAIFFSLGSNARSSDLSPKIITSIYTVLSKLKQRIIWKWEDDTAPGNSPNILYGKWLPQDDILAHTNVKLFITHGGLGSVAESEYHGVPMLGIPLFGDQFANMAVVEKAGYGLVLKKDEITAEQFEATIKEVLQNPIYRNNVKAFSQLYRDRPMNARDTAAYWIEYVIRHRGAKHLQSPAVNMNIIQYFGWDVVGLLLAVIYIAYKIFTFVLTKIFCMLCGRKIKNAPKSQNKEKKN